MGCAYGLIKYIAMEYIILTQRDGAKVHGKFFDTIGINSTIEFEVYTYVSDVYICKDDIVVYNHKIPIDIRKGTNFHNCTVNFIAHFVYNIFPKI